MKEILLIKNLRKYFFTGKLFNQKEVRAVDDISFSIREGQTLVLAGESGSGKTTVARLILRAIEPDSGEIYFDDLKITNSAIDLRKIRTKCQMIHQDPYAALDPRMSVFNIIKEPLDIHNIGDKEERKELVLQALKEVKLEPPDEIASKYTHMLSGGQRQRVAIARAITTKPKLIIADEPVSMLDVSVRAGILGLMKELQEKFNISFLYITHDLSTARYVGHVIAILYLGKIVEMGPIDSVLSSPKHPYTQALIDSISEPDPDNLLKERKIRIKDSSDVDIYKGCRFRARCPYVIEKCKHEPPLEEVEDNRRVACFVRIDQLAT